VTKPRAALRSIPPFAGRYPPFTEKAATAFAPSNSLNLVNNGLHCEGFGMSGTNFQSQPSDTIIGIVIATIGTLVLLSRLDVIRIGFNLPGELVTWWPLLLISWGVVLLFLPEKARR